PWAIVPAVATAAAHLSIPPKASPVTHIGLPVRDSNRLAWFFSRQLAGGDKKLPFSLPPASPSGYTSVYLSCHSGAGPPTVRSHPMHKTDLVDRRSEEHTSELQSR